MFKMLLFRLCLFFRGFEFSLNDVTSKDVPYGEFVMVADGNLPIHFRFYRMEYHDYRSWLGFKRKRCRMVYGVSTSMDAKEHPMLTQNFKNKLLRTVLPGAKLLDEKTLSRYLLNKYVDFIMGEVQRLSTKTELNTLSKDTGRRRRQADPGTSLLEVHAPFTGDTPQRREADVPPPPEVPPPQRRLNDPAEVPAETASSFKRRQNDQK